MGLKENFAQAVKELTGTNSAASNKDESVAPLKKGVDVADLRKAVEAETELTDFQTKYQDSQGYGTVPDLDKLAGAPENNANTYGTPFIPYNAEKFAVSSAEFGKKKRRRQNMQKENAQGSLSQGNSSEEAVTSATTDSAETYAAPFESFGSATTVTGTNVPSVSAATDLTEAAVYEPPLYSVSGKEIPLVENTGAKTDTAAFPASPSDGFAFPPVSQSGGGNAGGGSSGNAGGGFGAKPPSGNRRDPFGAGYTGDELTVISRNTVIDGNIRSFANMSIDGDIKGDVETTKNIDLNGKIVGNLSCNNAEMHAAQVQGNVRLKGNVDIERDTLLIGDLMSGYACINGKIKGSMNINGKAELREDSVLFGDLSAATLTVEDGAIIQGYVSTTFLNKDESRNIFPEQVTIGEV